jgi:Ribonucleases P/MRP protein subunit POP1
VSPLLNYFSTFKLIQATRPGLKRTCGMQSECTWRICGDTVWFVIVELSSFDWTYEARLSQAISPTEKSYRPSYRASVRGSILHDASYYSCVEISGPEKIIIVMLELCCDPQGAGPGSKRLALSPLPWYSLIFYYQVFKRISHP